MLSYFLLCVFTQLFIFLFSTFWKLKVYSINCNNPFVIATLIYSIFNTWQIYNTKDGFSLEYYDLACACDYTICALFLLVVGIDYYDFDINEHKRLKDEIKLLNTQIESQDKILTYATYVLTFYTKSITSDEDESTSSNKSEEDQSNKSEEEQNKSDHDEDYKYETDKDDDEKSDEDYDSNTYFTDYYSGL